MGHTNQGPQLGLGLGLQKETAKGPHLDTPRVPQEGSQLGTPIMDSKGDHSWGPQPGPQLGPQPEPQLGPQSGTTTRDPKRS